MSKQPDPRIGKRGCTSVTWPGGRVTELEGTVLVINEAVNEVYLETVLGPVVGDLDTLTMEDEE